MVFEAVVVDLLNKFLKQYIENLDTSQLKIGIWGGDVVLRDLQIKTILFDDFNLPVRVQWGKLGKLALKIPWTNLYSANVVVDIEELLLVIIPETEFHYDPVKEQKWENDKKQSRLKAVEEAKKKELEIEPAKQSDGFVEKLVSQIIKNIQIQIKNIHIRYEDKTTNINFPFSVGVTMSNLSAQTTSEGALITLSRPDLTENTNFICKIVNLSGLAIYWNSHSVLFSDLPSDELSKVLVDNIPTNDHKPDGYDYVFGPLSASAFAQINPKPELDGSNFTIPKFFVNLHLKEIDLAMTRNQFYDAILYAQDFRRLLISARYRKYRPLNIEVIGHAKEWWHFCYNCVAEDIKRRKLEWSWAYMKEHRKNCKKYFELYKIKITTKKVSSNVTEKLLALEKKLNVFNLLLLREQAYLEVERNNLAKESKPFIGNWFSGWFSYGAESKPPTSQDELVKTLESVMTPSEKKKLYKAIGYDESSPRPNYPPEFIEFQFRFYLDQIKVTIYDDEVQPLLNIMEMSITTLKMEFEQRAKENAIKFSMAIGKFQILGKKDTSKSDIPELVTSNCSDTESLVNILFETKPLNASCDQKIHVNARPLKIIYHAETINRVKEIFSSVSPDVNFAAATSASLPVFQKITTLGLKYAIEKRNIIELKINILSSYIIIPYGGVYKKDQEMLVLLLGRLTVETEKNVQKEINIRKLYLEGTTEQDVFSTILSASYTNFKCELKGVQILLQLNGENWVEASTTEGPSPLRFLESTNVVVFVKKSLVTDDARIPKIVVEGQLPSLTFNFSEDRFVAFAALLCSIPSKIEGEVQSNKRASVSAWSLQSFGTQIEKQFVHRTKGYITKGNIDYLQGIDLMSHFEMSELVVKVSKTKTSKSTSKLFLLDHLKKQIRVEEKFLDLRISKLEVEITSKTFEKVNLVKLGEIEFQQYLGEVTLPFVTTKKQDYYLFVVEYINVNPRIPDFYTQRGAIVNRLTLNVTPLNVIINKEAILAQLAFYNHVQRRLEKVKESCVHDRIADAGKPVRGISLETLNERKMLTKGRKFRKKKPKKEKIDFFLDANLEEIIITVENDNQGLMEFTLKEGSVEISTRKSSTNIDFKLQKILLLDLNTDTLYTKIVESFDEKTLSSRITVYNSDYFGSSSSVDMSVEAEIGGLRFCFLNSFFSRALAFLSAFHVQIELLKEGATAAAQKAKQNVMKAYQNTARICINMKINAPLLIIPRKTCSYEVLFVDLGVLTLKNQITELDYVIDEKIQSRPLIDTMKFHLQNLKFSRGILNLDMITLDDEKTFLIPVTFELSLNRNLSTAWFKVIPELEILARLAAVHIKLTHYDLTVIFSVLKENLSEGSEYVATNSSSQLEKPESKIKEIEDTRTIYTIDTTKDFASKEDSPNFYTTVKYMFFMDSFVFDAVVERDDSKEYTSNIGLARFVLETISLEGRLFSDGSTDMNMLLVSCLLDDTRPGKIGRLTRLMERTADNLTLNNELQGNSINSMIEVAFKKKDQDSFLDVKVYKFTLILSMEFLQKLGEFFTLEETKVDKVENTTRLKYSENKPRVFKEEVEEKEDERPPTFTFNLLVEKPDIVIVENMDSIDAECLILHAEIVMKYRYAGSRKVISSTINDVELYSCCFNLAKRKSTLLQVIKPFTVSVAGSTPPDQGLHVDICFTEIAIIINPSTVELVSKCYEVLMGSTLHDKKEEKNKDFSNLWEVRPLKPEDQWFLKAEEGIDALTAISYSSSDTLEEKVALEEVCLITIPLILLSLNGSAKNQLKPLLSLKMGFQSQCHNWSSRMNIISSLNLQLQYYNKIVSTWEPMIEPVEIQADEEQKIKHSYTPWEVNSTIVFDDEGYLDIEKSPKMSVTISCEEILPITLTKTGIEVLKDVIDTYGSAVSKGFISKPIDLPPFILKNQTGLTVELLLSESDLQMCQSIYNFYQTVKIEPSSEALLQRKSESRGARILPFISSEKKFSTLCLRFPVARSTVFEVPLNLTTKRYYPVRIGRIDKELWGLVVDISITDITTTISLQSVIKITSYFETPITIHSLSEDGTSADFVGTVEGRSSFTLPFQSVYRSQKKLFFSVKGYTFSSQPFCWTDIKSEFNFSRLLHCDSRLNESYDPFFMQVEGEIEQIYFSNTNRRTLSSMCYNIYLQPTVKIVNALPVDLIIICQGSSKDKTLRPGNNLQITNAEPKGFSLSLRIQDYLEREWSCKEKIEENPAEFLVWKFVSYNGLTSEVLNLGIHCTSVRKTAVYTIYCPYFLVNKTDRLLSYRFEGSQTVFHHPSSLKMPMMFSPIFKKFFSKKSAFLKVRHSEWSEKFPVDVAGSGGTIECENPTSNSVYKVSVSIRLTTNGLTKVVTFTPFYVLTNETDCTLECQESDFPDHAWLEIPKNSCLPFWPLSKSKKKTIKIKPKGIDTSTPSFAYDSTDSCLLRMDNKYGGFFANIQATQIGTYVTFSSYEPGQAPVLIINYSDKNLKLYETQSDFEINLEPSQQIMHAWVKPTGKRELSLSNLKNSKEKIIIEQDSVGLLWPSKETSVRYVSFLDGAQRVLLFTDDVNLTANISSSAKDSNSGIEVICRIQGIGLSLVNNHVKTEILYMACVSTGITWETKKLGKSRFKIMSSHMADMVEEAYNKYLHDCDTMPSVKSVVEITKQLKVDFNSMKVIYPHNRDLRRTFDPGFWMAYRVVDDQVMFDLKINRLQIDNQIRDCIFPVVLSPVPPPKTIAALFQRPKPFFELSIIKKLTYKSGVYQFKYFEILVQEFQVKIDIGFLQQFWLFFAPEEVSTEEKKTRFLRDLKLTQEPLQSHVEVLSSQQHKHFYELLHFSPLKIRFSFSLAGKLDSKSLPPFLGITLQTLGVTLTDVHDVIFRLSYFERKFVFLTLSQLKSEVISHYHGQFVRQAYVLLLGLDVIGNPYGLIVGIGEGVEAFFYEPFQGMVHGPSEFATGVAIGCKSLFGRTVGSTAGTLGKLTETLGKGLAVLSLDKEYQLQRMEAQHLHENIHTSMARGGRGLLMGVVEGVTGVVKKPMQGAKEEGVGGFFKGMGKGMMGLVTRPVTGVVDFASTSLNAVKRVAESHPELKQNRPPRFFRDEKIVQPYNLYEATGNCIFYSICKRKYCSTDKYEHHIQLRNKEVVILTNKRMILAEYNDLYGTWQEHMSIRWSTMPTRPQCHSKGIAITLPTKAGAPKKEKPDLKVLLISNPIVKEEMCQKMVELYKIEEDNLNDEGFPI